MKNSFAYFNRILVALIFKQISLWIFLKKILHAYETFHNDKHFYFNLIFNFVASSGFCIIISNICSFFTETGMNEDGSFIGQYGRKGKQNSSNNQAFATLV
jgi:hypothetical protein